MNIGALLTLGIVAGIIVIILFRVRAASKAADQRRREKERRDKERREAAQKGLLDTLDRMKNPDRLEAAKNAIQKDPKRAAKVLSRMMRDGK